MHDLTEPFGNDFKLHVIVPVGKCLGLRDRIDIVRANQKPLFTQREPITGCFRHSHQTLYARCNTRVQVVFDSHQTTLFASTVCFQQPSNFIRSM